MTRALQSALGVALIALGAFVLVKLPGRSEWVALVLVGFGGFLVSKTATIEAIKAAKDLLPWRAP